MNYLDHVQAGQSNQLIYIFKMLKCIELDERLKAMDQEITVNPQFVQKVIDLMSCKGFGVVSRQCTECWYLRC